MKQTLEQIALIERRDAWIRRLSQLFFTALFALLLTGAVVGGLAFIVSQQESTQRDSRAAATRRIDMLQTTVAEQASQIAENAKQIGQLTAAQAALTAQLRQNRIEPVVTVTPTPSPAPSPARTTAPAATRAPSPSPIPRPSPTKPRHRPSPSPSPTCRSVPIFGCPPHQR